MKVVNTSARKKINYVVTGYCIFLLAALLVSYVGDPIYGSVFTIILGPFKYFFFGVTHSWFLTALGFSIIPWIAFVLAKRKDLLYLYTFFGILVWLFTGFMGMAMSYV